LVLPAGVPGEWKPTSPPFLEEQGERLAHKEIAMLRRLAVLLLASLPVAGQNVPGAASADSRAQELAAADCLPISGRLELHPDLLPAGASASFPAFDGDSFAVFLTPRAAGAFSSQQAFDEMLPLLRAVGFGRPATDLSFAPGQGSRLPGTDVAALARELCPAAWMRRGRASAELCGALAGTPPAGTPPAGTALSDLRRDLERDRIEYVFQQQVAGIPIDSSGVIADRRDGESPHLVHGTLFNRFALANRPLLPSALAATLSRAALRLLAGGCPTCEPTLGGDGLVLVLLPYGSGRAPDGSTVPALRYAYRATVSVRTPARAGAPIEPRSWMAWIDAETAKVLRFVPQFASQSATGNTASNTAVVTARTWCRDPGTALCTRTFLVDKPPSGPYTLRLKDLFARLDLRGDDVADDGELTLATPGTASSPLLDQTAAGNALCASSTPSKSAFRQMNAYAHLSSFWSLMAGAGTIEKRFERPVSVYLDVSVASSGNTNRAYYDDQELWLMFTEGNGFVAGSGCPDASGTKLNGAQDATSLAHEFGHLATWRLQERRPKNWCGLATQPCSLPNPLAHATFHDFADAFADSYAATNCMSGWSNKNEGGKNQSRNCFPVHNEGSGLPRLADDRDRFPEHRAKATGPYADGQIASAALWFTLEGMSSRTSLAGRLRYWASFNQALWGFGLLSQSCAACDRDIYRFLQNLLLQQAGALASSGPEGQRDAYKALSGFARVGIHTTSQACLQLAGSSPCLASAGAPVIDVDDNDTGAADDLVVDGITHRETDYLKRSGVKPAFLVWTGPAFRFDASGKAVLGVSSAPTTLPCDDLYKVDVALDATFTNTLRSSGWSAGARAKSCFVRWDGLTDPDWASLRGPAGGTAKLYYRVTSKSCATCAEKPSTQPFGGTFQLPPAYAVVNDSGQP
jgi:hypothetical protein